MSTISFQAESYSARINGVDQGLKIDRTAYNRDCWAIRQAGMRLNKKREWEWEPIPSSRDDEFLERTTHTLEDAQNSVFQYLTSGRAKDHTQGQSAGEKP